MRPETLSKLFRARPPTGHPPEDVIRHQQATGGDENPLPPSRSTSSTHPGFARSPMVEPSLSTTLRRSSSGKGHQAYRQEARGKRRPVTQSRATFRLYEGRRRSSAPSCAGEPVDGCWGHSPPSRPSRRLLRPDHHRRLRSSTSHQRRQYVQRPSRSCKRASDERRPRPRVRHELTLTHSVFFARSTAGDRIVAVIDHRSNKGNIRRVGDIPRDRCQHSMKDPQQASHIGH